MKLGKTTRNNIFFVCNNIGGLMAIKPLIKFYLKKKYKCIVFFNNRNISYLKKLKAQLIPLKNNNYIIDIKNYFIKYDPLFIITASTFPKDKIIGDLENLFILQSIKEKILSISVLDHWCGYKDRYEFFDTNKNSLKRIIPDFICVMDINAKKEMKKYQFPENKLIVTGNPSWEQIKYRLKAIDNLTKNEVKKKLGLINRKKNILFISELISEEQTVLKYPFDEFQVLNTIINVTDDDYDIIICRHPREEKNKYDKFILQNKNRKIILANKKFSINKWAFASDSIIGITSMLLVELSLSGFNVLSYQPSALSEPVINLGYGIKKIYNRKMLKKLFINNNKKK